MGFQLTSSAGLRLQPWGCHGRGDIVFVALSSFSNIFLFFCGNHMLGGSVWKHTVYKVCPSFWKDFFHLGAHKMDA